MAKHISEGREFPVYLWGAHYAGTLVSYLAAPLFRLFGFHPGWFAFTPLIFAFFTFVLLRKLAEELLDRRGTLAALLIAAVPSYGILWLSLFAGGCHSETLLFGTVILWFAAKFSKNRPEGSSFYLWFGVSCGVGLWLSPAVFPFILMALIIFFRRSRGFFLTSSFAVFVVGFLMGHLPALFYAISHPTAAPMRLGGRILHLSRTDLEAGSAAANLARAILWRISTIPRSLLQIPISTAALAGIPGAALFFFALIRDFLHDRRNLCGTTAACFILFYALFVGETAPRYMLDLCILMPIVLGGFLSSLAARTRLGAAALLILLLSFNVRDLVERISHANPHHYRELSAWLMENGINRGYSDYWVSFPVIFHSGEEVLISPTLLHPSFDDRLPAYTRDVASAPQIAYVIDNRSYPRLSERLALLLDRKGLKYRREDVLEFSVFHELPHPVKPEELGLP